MDRFLAGRAALVIGGSGGIGSAVSIALSRAGASVVIHGGSDRDRLDRTVAAARAVSSPSAGEQLVRGVLAQFATADDAFDVLDRCGPVDILVVSFGPYLDAPLHDTGRDHWRRLVELNLLLPAFLIDQCLPRMIENRFGRIVLFGGPRGDRVEGYRRIAAYASAKMGVSSLVRSVARQYASEGIRCNMISPGYVATEYMSDTHVSDLARQRPTGRLVSTEEVASLCMTLLRPESEPLNGAIFPMDFGE